MKISHIFNIVIASSLCITHGITLAQNKQIIEEIYHTYVIQNLNPNITLIGTKAPTFADTTAEKTLQSWLSAMKQSSHAEVMSFWDDESRAKLRELDLRNNKSNAQWEQEWRRLMSNTTVTATNKIIYGKYEIFTLEIKNNATSSVLKETVALYKTGSNWRLTTELVENVVFNKWDSDQTRIQRLASPLYKKIQSK
jgi:hypothetical protein